MATPITVPTLGESVTEATVSKWFKTVGDPVVADEPLVELETDKVTVEVPAAVAGTLESIAAAEGAEVAVGAVLGTLAEGAVAAGAVAAPKPAAVSRGPERAEAPAESAHALAPAVRRLVDEHGLDAAAIPASGKDGRLTKADVVAFLDKRPATVEAPPPPALSLSALPPPPAAPRPDDPREKRVRMTRLRQRIAQRLKEAQNTAAMLTTFNEVDMTAAQELRTLYKDAFEKRHGVRLGFMALFVKACVVALKEWPAVNAEIDGTDLVYKNHYDIGVAVGSPQGLVVPVLRDADAKSFAEIEASVRELGQRARDGKLTMEELQGGTFTITNGGVFGSLMSTPILNPPQSGILGMHKIQPRPMVMPDGTIQARPMMYVALSYDHRVIDGREAVSFLVRVKDCIEDPRRILVDA